MKDERLCPPVSASALSSFILPTSSLIGTGGMSDKLQLVAGSVKKLLSHAHDKLKLIGPRLAEGTGVEPASDKCAVVFKTTALPVRLPFQEEFRIANCGFRICTWPLPLDSLRNLAGTLGFEPRISILETDGLPVSLHP